jgi:glutathione peroxidase
MEAAMTAHDFEFTAIDGQKMKLSQFAGKPVLIVNTASECGLTPQYRGLQALWEKYRDRGLVVLGVPCNDFGGQEPGTEAEIKNFCTTQYQVGFPMTSKNAVIGANAHPLFKWAVAEAGDAATPKWNFHKHLIDGKGALVATFGSRTAPDDKAIIDKIEAQLPQ